ncbi:hypothetical protein PInf_008720 [Phytophthora infestans]|nr:hypothetical protein PInf_008720 [Phytophthora infestans]
MFVQKAAADTYSWAKLVALNNTLFARIDDPVIHAAVRYKAMDRKTLLNRMISVVGKRDVKIMHELSVPQMPLIKNVSAFMKKMKTVKRVDKLKLHGCYYKPISLHELRWGGCYRMLKRFEDLQPYMHLVMDDCTAQDDASDDFTTYSNTENLQRIPLVDLITSPRDQRNIFALLN